MRTPLGPSRTSKSLHRTVPTSDVPTVARRHARVGFLAARCAHQSTVLADGVLDVDLPAEGLRFVPPVRAERARARERLPSYREPSSRNPRPGLHVFLLRGRGARVPFRLLSTRAPRQAVLRASFRLAPWCFHHEVSRPPGAQDARCVRSMSATRTIACTRTSRVPGSFRRFRGVEALRSLGSAQPDRGPGRSRRPRSLRRIVIEHVTSRPEPLARPARSRERGRFLPTVHDATEPLTLLSPLPLPPPLTRLRACDRPLRFLRVRVVGGKELPRPRSPPPRERRRFSLARSAFRHQGLFVGSGGPYSPGPATTAPLLAMTPPLDGVLTPP
jgi:hypothetical protein